MDEGLLVGESGMKGVCDVSKLFFFFFSFVRVAQLSSFVISGYLKNMVT